VILGCLLSDPNDINVLGVIYDKEILVGGKIASKDIKEYALETTSKLQNEMV